MDLIAIELFYMAYYDFFIWMQIVHMWLLWLNLESMETIMWSIPLFTTKDHTHIRQTILKVQTKQLEFRCRKRNIELSRDSQFNRIVLHNIKATYSLTICVLWLDHCPLINYSTKSMAIAVRSKGMAGDLQWSSHLYTLLKTSSSHTLLQTDPTQKWPLTAADDELNAKQSTAQRNCCIYEVCIGDPLVDSDANEQESN